MTPGSTTATRFWRSISLMALIPTVESTIPPVTGTHPPDLPDPAARGVIGTSASLATARARRMSSAEEARTTASGSTGS
jgi:hypothetical protein